MTHQCTLTSAFRLEDPYSPPSDSISFWLTLPSQHAYTSTHPTHTHTHSPNTHTHTQHTHTHTHTHTHRADEGFPGGRQMPWELPDIITGGLDLHFSPRSGRYCLDTLAGQTVICLHTGRPQLKGVYVRVCVCVCVGVCVCFGGCLCVCVFV